MKKSKRISTGDIVTINNPEFFIRCGYPLSPSDTSVKEKIEIFKPDFEKFIKQCLNKLDGKEGKESEKVFYDLYPSKRAIRSEERASRVFLQELAYLYCKSHSFGGNQRSIYTENIPELKDKRFKVIDFTACYTGERSPGTQGGYYGDGDWEPPYLGEAKYHHILHLQEYFQKVDSDNWSTKLCGKSELLDQYKTIVKMSRNLFSESYIMIEDIHVSRIDKKDENDEDNEG